MTVADSNRLRRWLNYWKNGVCRVEDRVGVNWDLVQISKVSKRFGFVANMEA